MLNLTEVVKRQNPKSKKGFNQVRAPLSSRPRPAGAQGACRHLPVCVHAPMNGVQFAVRPPWVSGEEGEPRGKTCLHAKAPCQGLRTSRRRAAGFVPGFGGGGGLFLPDLGRVGAREEGGPDGGCQPLRPAAGLGDRPRDRAAEG